MVHKVVDQKNRLTCPRLRKCNRPLAQLLSALAIGVGGLGFDSRAGQIGAVSSTVRHHSDVSSELCSPGAKSRRWAPSLVTRFGVLTPV